jgi:hypothetical protein
MSKKKHSQKKVVKNPNFKLISYTLKATIPTGQYANIQPEITVSADTIEHAERAVMPYIETLFAKYRDGGVRPIEPVRSMVVVKPVPITAKALAAFAQAPVAPKPQETPAPDQIATVALAGSPFTPIAPVVAAPAAIVLTVPFTRAKGALDSCTSLAALKLVSDQVEKSTKLVDSEKVELRKISAEKLAKLNG